MITFRYLTSNTLFLFQSHLNAPVALPISFVIGFVENTHATLMTLTASPCSHSY